MTAEELQQLTAKVITPDPAVRAQVQAVWDGIAKPLHSLGRFEDLVARIGAMIGSTQIDIRTRAVVVMCADNGIVEEGISQSGQEVTALVAASMARGRSSVCRMARRIGADVIPVDIGINGDVAQQGIVDRKIKCGTRNFLKEPAMTREETLQAIHTGIELVRELKDQGYRMLATGEMGIGNTTTSSAVAAALLHLDPEEITGKGAGLSDEGLIHKRQVVRQGLETYDLYEADTLTVLSTVGGLDIAGLCGVFIGGALMRIPVVIDGVISAIAALTAKRLVPGVEAYAIPSHLSREPAAARIMDELGLRPVIDADMALGEGTGAVMMFSLLDMAMTVYDSQTSFEEIGIEPYEHL